MVCGSLDARVYLRKRVIKISDLINFYKMKYLKQIFTVCFLLSAAHLIGQDVDLDKLLDEEMAKKNKNTTEYTTGTFKTSRLITSHTVETTNRGVLDLKISHR